MTYAEVRRSRILCICNQFVIRRLIMDTIEQFLKWVKESDNIVFLEVPVYLRRVEFRISGV